ncbi:MAG TPA: LPS assembly protein LptD [Acetobacteraceae bacterium]
MATVMACCTIMGLVTLATLAPAARAQQAGVTTPGANAGPAPTSAPTPPPTAPAAAAPVAAPAPASSGPPPGKVGPTVPLRRDQPVYYQADTATYDRDLGIVTLTGHVEFWQNDRILLADKVTYNRNTDVAAATGHVVLLDPNGQTVFSDYAELTGGMKDGVMTGMRALLAQNGRLAANGARRTDAEINELSRAVYSTCNLCVKNPNAPPLWDIRARSAVQDVEHKMIEYHDAVVEMYGIPVLYTPYLSHPDPSQKRASGILVPSFGYSTHIGAFLQVPYYWVIDGQSDATISPIVATKTAGVFLQYRRRFNDGTVTINASAAAYQGPAGHIFSQGVFNLDDTWRWGFNINRASSEKYINDFRIAGAQTVLTSTLYLEGFGQGAYSRLETSAYQGLTTSVSQEKVPYVLPHYEYSFTGQPDALGGRTTVDAGAFNVLRYQGTSDQRVSLSTSWDRPFNGPLGDKWMFTLHEDAAAYSAHGLDMQPNFSPIADAQSAQGMVSASVKLNWPFVRSAGAWGTQTIEPIAQVIVAPRGSSYTNTNIPNEDALDQEFTDATLFSLNRFSGMDRLEGGTRANVALHANWVFPRGASIDGLVGQGYRLQPDTAFAVGSGLRNTATDIVSHISYTPNQYFDFTSRQRFDHNNFNVRFVDAIATAGPQYLKVSGGYLYTFNNPYTMFDFPPTTPNTALTTPRNELTLGLNTTHAPWHFGISGTRELGTGKMASAGVDAGYDDECFTFDVRFYRRYTSLDNDSGATTILFQITFKTVGEIGFNAS